VVWYEETFQGIIEGTAPPSAPDAGPGPGRGSSKWLRPRGPADASTIRPVNLTVKPISRTIDGSFADYVFQITW
jgi:hypothetical protein